MEANKIILNGNVLINLENDTAIESDVAQGKTFHLADGTIGVGTATGGGSPEGTIYGGNLNTVTQVTALKFNKESTSLDFTGFDTSEFTNMNQMFAICESLTSLDLSSFNTSNVTIMDGMFFGCWLLTSLDLSSFNTSNVTTMISMFDSCSSLNTLNISNFSFDSIPDSNSVMLMFESVPSTCVIYVNQAAYDFIANNYMDMGLADLSMLQVVSNS